VDHTNFQVYDYLMTLLVAISFRLLCLLSIMVPICPVTNILWQHRTFCRNINSLNQGCNQLTFKAGNNDCNLFYLTTVNFLAHSKCFLKFCGRAIARLPPPLVTDLTSIALCWNCYSDTLIGTKPLLNPYWNNSFFVVF